jgi:hypothetical protein
LVRELDSLIRRYNNILKVMRSGCEVDFSELRTLEEKKEELMMAMEENGYAQRK